MTARHGALPETLAGAQGAVFMPLEALLVYIADCKLRSPPINFKYASAAAVMLLGATVLLLRGVADGQASAQVPIAWVLSSRRRDCYSARTRHRKAIGLLSALFARAVLAAS